MDIDEKINKLEKVFSVPGTQISRVYKENGGVQWCLSIGSMGSKKIFYYGDTIEKVVHMAYENPNYE